MPEKVRGFYASLYHETQGGNPPRVPNVPQIHWAFFTVDDAKNLWTSKYWVKVQRPYVGNRPGELMPNFNDVRDETVIGPEEVITRVSGPTFCKYLPKPLRIPLCWAGCH